jgi:hypothetical protein
MVCFRRPVGRLHRRADRAAWPGRLSNNDQSIRDAAYISREDICLRRADSRRKYGLSRKGSLDIGGFDPLFGPGALFIAEEIDAVGRASAMGWEGEYHPEVVVTHHHGRKTADAEALRKSYAIGRGAFHIKLLLTGHQFLWFARSVYQLRSHYRTSRTTVL